MISLLRKLAWLFRRRRKESDLLEEIEFHIAEETEEQESAGLTREAARRRARLQFGNPVRVQEEVRSAWSWIVLEQFRQDLSFAARGFWRAKGFTAGAVAVLALGIGANLTLFQILDAGIVHRYSIPDAERFVRLSRMSGDRNGRVFPSVAVEFYRANTRVFDSLVSEDTSAAVVIDGTPGRRTNFVSDNYFSSVAIRPALGRVFNDEDSRLDSPAVALLGHQYWRTQFAGDPQVLGRSIQVNDVAVQIVGVLPEDFSGFTRRPTELWLPVRERRLLIRGNPAGQSELFGKLKPGTTLAPGLAELTALTRELSQQQPRYFGEGDRIQGDLVQESLLNFFLTRSPIIVIFVGTVLLILLSACAHLGNMLLARGMARQHEFAIRMSIGASRERLTRQLATENILLAVLGSAAGLAAGTVAARLFVVLSDGPAVDVSIHWQTFVACVAMTFISVFAFGLPSARATTRHGFQATSLSSRLVANQVSISCVLLIITGVFAVNGLRSGYLDLRFDYRSIVVVDPQLYAAEGRPDALQRRLEALSARLAELPGVESVTTATGVPLRGSVGDNYPNFPRVYRSAVAPSFFDVLGLRIVRGRTFQSGEQDAVIASESAARSLWPNQDPLGQLWNVAGRKHTVVGVVQDSGANDLSPEMIDAYLPISARDVERCLLILRTRGEPSPLVGMIPRVSKELDESVEVISMSALLERGRRLRIQDAAKIFGPIGLISTALAAAGMFALIAFTVVQRTREIGIRIAIGATRQDLLLGLLKLHAKTLGGGVAKGAIGAVILLLFIRTFAYPIVYVVLLGGFVVGLAGFAAVAALSTLIPALRALRIDPASALRAE